MEGNKLSFVSIISDIAWGLGYCGMPHILVRFMAVKSEKELKKSSKIAIVWIALSLFAACFIGVVGRAYLVPALAKGSEETVFISMIKTIFSGNGLVVFIGGLFLCGILAAVMSTADSQLLVCASSVSKDIYKNILKPDAKDKKVLLVTRSDGTCSSCFSSLDRLESGQQHHESGIRRLGRSWLRIRPVGCMFPLLEAD